MTAIRLLREAEDDAMVLVQNPVRLSELSEPQPDLALLEGREDFYSQNHPGPVDEPGLSAPIEISALSGVTVELHLLFG